MVQISGFPDYCAYASGRIWSTRSQRFLKPNKGAKYPYVVLYKDGKRHEKRVHRLILETLVGPCPDGMEGCHNDGNRRNNGLDNLRWDTRKSNMHDAIRHGTHSCLRCGEQSGNSKLKEQDARMVIYTYRTGLFTFKEIAGFYNVVESTVNNIVIGRNWRHIQR